MTRTRAITGVARHAGNAALAAATALSNSAAVHTGVRATTSCVAGLCTGTCSPLVDARSSPSISSFTGAASPAPAAAAASAALELLRARAAAGAPPGPRRHAVEAGRRAAAPPEAARHRARSGPPGMVTP